MFDLRMKILLLLILTLCAAATVLAAGLSDPMQPPKGMVTRPTASSEKSDTEVGWALRSVLIGSKRAIAIIDGTPISLGERYRGAKLLKIEAGEVVLQDREGKKIVLTLTPDIHKTKVSAGTEISLR